MATVSKIVIDDETYLLPRPLEVGEEPDRKNVLKTLINAWKEDYESKPQELYNKIKEMRDGARLERYEHIRKQDISDEEKSESLGEICAFNYVLMIMENMFEVFWK